MVETLMDNQQAVCDHKYSHYWDKYRNQCSDCGKIAYKEILKLRKKPKRVLSDAPCTKKCWEANQESDCLCSCGGANHGKGKPKQ
jgi:hypothetical protein